MQNLCFEIIFQYLKLLEKKIMDYRCCKFVRVIRKHGHILPHKIQTIWFRKNKMPYTRWIGYKFRIKFENRCNCNYKSRVYTEVIKNALRLRNGRNAEHSYPLSKTTGDTEKVKPFNPSYANWNQDIQQADQGSNDSTDCPCAGWHQYSVQL